MTLLEVIGLLACIGLLVGALWALTWIVGEYERINRRVGVLWEKYEREDI